MLVLLNFFKNVGPLRRTQQFAYANAAGGRVAGVPPALPQRTRESRVPSGSRARMPASSELAGANRQLAFGLLQLVALLSSHPLFYRILAWRDSLVFISPA